MLNSNPNPPSLLARRLLAGWPHTLMQNTTTPPVPCDQNEIARRAYLLWEQAGRPPGQHLRFWLEAEGQVLATAVAAQPPAAPAKSTVAAAPPPRPARAGNGNGKKQVRG